MSEESIPAESAEPDPASEETAPAPSPLETQPALQRTRAILTACAILVLPVGYLLLHRSPVNVGKPAVPAALAQSQSIAALEGLVRAQPTAANRINLSLAYIQAGKPAPAVPVLQTVLAEDQKNAIAWNNLCVAHTMQQEYGNGIDDCNHALAIQPDFPLAKNNLKWATDERDATIKAISDEEQTDISKRDASFYLAEGLNFLHLGNYNEAIHAWHRALDMDPHNAAAANNIGTALMFQKQPKAAAVWFQKAINLAPTMQLAKNNLAWAQQEETRPAR